MGRNSIERGSRDSWTASPSDIERVKAAITKDRTTAENEGNARDNGGAGAGAVGDPVFQFGRGTDPKYFTDVLHAPNKRDPRGYILPSDQPDFLTATKFVNTLRHNGVQVSRATASFTVNGKRYPAGSYVVKSAQAFRPMVLDMFEPQDHPNDFAYPGGPPKRPYDNAGYTLAYQMGVQFDRILDGFDGPFQEIKGLATPPAGRVTDVAAARGYLVRHETNDAFVAVTRALKANVAVSQLRARLTANGRTYPAGTFYSDAGTGAARSMLQEL